MCCLTAFQFQRKEGHPLREDSLTVLSTFLERNFALPTRKVLAKRDFPPLPLLLSLVDTAIDRKHAFGRDWPVEALREVRASIEYAIFTVLKKTLKRLPPNSDFHYQLFKKLPKTVQPTVISLNYDLIVDNSMSKLGQDRSGRPGVLHMPDYGTEVSPSRGRESVPYGKLFKIHGSLHWLYCPSCSRLRVNIAKSRAFFVKGIWQDVPRESCRSRLAPVMITPTHLKDYRNPHIASVWYEAEQSLRNADRVIIVGYSLPDDDVEVAYLLKRGLDRLPKHRVTVVGHDPDNVPKDKNETWQRYRVILGPKFEWRPDGFKGWLEKCSSRNPWNRRLDNVAM